jgi:hypothetical protein
MENQEKFINIQLFGEKEQAEETSNKDAEATKNEAGDKAQKTQNDSADEMISKAEALKLADKKATQAQKAREEALRAEFEEQNNLLKSELKKLQDAGKSQEEIMQDKLKEAEETKSKYERMVLKSELETKYATQGFTSEEYSQIVEAQLKSDHKSTADLISKAVNNLSLRLAKEKYNSTNSNITKPSGENASSNSMTKDKFDKFTYTQKVEAISKNPDLKKFL